MMVKRKDIRIGNYLTDLFGNVVEVNSIGLLTVMDDNGVEFNYKSLMPIEITDEVLIKCGIKMINPKYFVIGKFVLLNKNGWKLDYEEYDMVRPESIMEVKFVHQLQNGYYILTGKDLNIKL